jgi:hypothetical protein
VGEFSLIPEFLPPTKYKNSLDIFEETQRIEKILPSLTHDVSIYITLYLEVWQQKRREQTTFISIYITVLVI